MAERHSSARQRWDPWDDPYDMDGDWGSYAAATARDRSRGPDASDLLKTLDAMGPIPCSLCEPGYVCQFHRE